MGMGFVDVFSLLKQNYHVFKLPLETESRGLTVLRGNEKLSRGSSILGNLGGRGSELNFLVDALLWEGVDPEEDES